MIQTQLTENLTVWELWYFKAVTSYRGERFQVPTRFTTITRQTGEYKVDLTRHSKFALALGELASGRFPHWHCLTMHSGFNHLIDTIQSTGELSIDEKLKMFRSVNI